jgi:phosphomethylpyrimidine synthase
MTNPERLAQVAEIRDGLASLAEMLARCEDGSALVLRGRRHCVALGDGTMVKVNTLLGCSNIKDLDQEIWKVDKLSSAKYVPDMLMDLSIVRPAKPLYEVMIDRFGGPIGTLPHYLCYKPRRGIDKILLMEEVNRQAEAGIGWMTLHLTARKELFEKACRLRRSPTTARGGAIVIEDMYIRGSSEGILGDMFDDLMKVFRRFGVVLAVGTVFRPSNIFEALDEVHLEETSLQGEYISAARKAGVSVIMEGVGHITLDRIPEYVRITKGRFKVPFMPLGPIVTDAAVGADHIASAIGAAYMALIGGADAINSVTREEHAGGVPSCDAVLEGARTARIVAHSVNITRFGALKAVDLVTVRRRSEHETCVVHGGLLETPHDGSTPGCARCGTQCPLRIGPGVIARSHSTNSDASDAP